jgi:hypothetical protein
MVVDVKDVCCYEQIMANLQYLDPVPEVDEHVVLT